ncbi:adenylate/guanylate cyclase domain-containing protein [Natronoglycomyces albus]|uniref:adenylate/guanylate cyclase domain-containing protein n=1 Tax=Natronoglycomyces albus TaxID=2811108 RepID=UPI001FE95F37|nr:adenylate/guanylate cyclase domain-containing protein [Natronoglycomyces albus]
MDTTMHLGAAQELVRLPQGRVTFLFTDIEGSTRLANSLGPRGYRQLLENHREILRAVFAAHRGCALGTEGDSFFVVFSDARDAIRAALAAQQQMKAYGWQHRPKVRMGLHTGPATPTAQGYATAEVHRTARISSAAHGDQVLCSRSTLRAAGIYADRPLVPGIGTAGDVAAEGFDIHLARIGLCELRGFCEPTEIFQISAAGMRKEFPPSPLHRITHNLPAEMDAVMERPADYAELSQLFNGHRMVTITGLSGSGKSTVAMSWARQQLALWPDGVWLLAGQGDRSLEEQWVRATGMEFDLLRRRSALLLIDAAPKEWVGEISYLLRTAPNIKILATAAKPIGVTGEVKWALPPLDDRTATEVLCHYSGHYVGGRQVGDCAPIVEQLDGFLPALLPLAKPVAMRGAVSVARSLARNPYKTINYNGAFEKEMEATIAALSAEARKLLRSLSAYPAGAAVEQIEELADVSDSTLDALIELVDACLVRVNSASGEASYRLPNPVKWHLQRHLPRLTMHPLHQLPSRLVEAPSWRLSPSKPRLRASSSDKTVEECGRLAVWTRRTIPRAMPPASQNRSAAPTIPTCCSSEPGKSFPAE